MKPSNSTEVPDLIRIGDKVQIRRRGKRGKYVAEFWHAGQHRRRSLQTTRLDIARQRAILLEAELLTGAYKPRPKHIALAYAVDEYLTEKKNQGLKPKSLIKYKDWLYSLRDFATRQEVRFLNQFTDRVFEDFRAHRKKTQKPKSMYTGLTIVKQFAKWASGGGRDYLPSNPVARCKVMKPYVPPKFTPTLEQVNAILDKATGDRKSQYALAAFSGIREEELMMLGPASVDRKGGWIQIAARDQWTPKTRQARKIPIHVRLNEILEGKLPPTVPYYFCSAPSPKYPNGDHFINGKHMNDDLQKLAKSLGIPVGRKNDGLVFHSLRHFFETRCVDSGVPQFVVDAWMGHAGGSSMGRVYYGLTDAKSQEYMKQVKF
jgi:integrase